MTPIKPKNIITLIKPVLITKTLILVILFYTRIPLRIRTAFIILSYATNSKSYIKLIAIII